MKHALLAYYNAARNPLTHKGDYGRVFIVAGSEGMTGAALLCAESALRAGAGLVYLLAPGKLLPIYEIGCREAVKVRIGEDSTAWFREKDVRQVADEILSAGGPSAVVLGPGLGRRPETRLFVSGLLRVLAPSAVPVILDADGLYACSGNCAWLTCCPRLIVTPHAAELSRLTGTPLPEVNRHRKESALACAAQTGAVTVLKGSGTVIADILPTKEVLCEINESGNPGMATGGSGDVLAGMLAGILASDGAPAEDRRHLFELVCCGVYMHGLCGDLAAQRYGQRAVKAGDLIEMMKEVHHYEI